MITIIHGCYTCAYMQFRNDLEGGNQCNIYILPTLQTRFVFIEVSYYTAHETSKTKLMKLWHKDTDDIDPELNTVSVSINNNCILYED